MGEQTGATGMLISAASVLELRQCASMIRTWAPETFPANEDGKIHFARAVMESVASTIEAVLAGHEGMAKDLRAHWHSFCDADAFPGSDTFTERMELAGLVECVPVTEEALESAFAAQRGVEPGGMMWVLTEAGKKVMEI